MKGIILLSHGPMAKGLYETTQWFFGNEIEQYEYVCLQEEDKQDAFVNQVEEKIAKVDTGEGVILFTDLFGGTPCNCCMKFMSDNIQLISGMNLTIVLELLGNRLSNTYDIEELLSTGKNGLIHVNTYHVNTEDDFFDD